jgi:hypothetical protein
MQYGLFYSLANATTHHHVAPELTNSTTHYGVTLQAYGKSV